MGFGVLLLGCERGFPVVLQGAGDQPVVWIDALVAPRRQGGLVSCPFQPLPTLAMQLPSFEFEVLGDLEPLTKRPITERRPLHTTAQRAFCEGLLEAHGNRAGRERIEHHATDARVHAVRADRLPARCAAGDRHLVADVAGLASVLV